jgi:hypothetical protein
MTSSLVVGAELRIQWGDFSTATAVCGKVKELP